MLVSHLLEVDAKCTVVIVPPFSYRELQDNGRPVATLSDVMWKKAKSSVIHLIRVPGIQVKWKKHQEVLKRHAFVVYGKWENFEEYKRLIREAKEDGNDEERKMKEYEDYQLLKVWNRSMQNMKLLRSAKSEGECNLFFIESKADYLKLA